MPGSDTSTLPSQPPDAGGVPILPIWFVLGLSFGLLEGGYMRFARVVLHQSTKLGRHVVWMAPTMDLIWMALPALFLLALRLVRPRWVTLRLTAGVFMFIGFLGLLFVFEGLGRYASILLAAGLAMQLSRLCVRWPARFLAAVRHGVWAVPLLVALAAADVYFFRWRTEQRALARLGPAAPGAPNVLLLVLDTVRSWDVSADGYDLPTTPALEEFASGGVRFSRAWAPSSWTLLSHESMFTGLFPHQMTGGLRTSLDGTPPTLAEELQHRGYWTGGFVANLHYCSREFGLDRGFMHYEAYVVSAGELFLNSSLGRFLATNTQARKFFGYYDIIGRKDAATLNRSLLEWLPEHSERPFFAFVNYYDAHEPYFPPEDFEARFASPTPRKLYNTDQSIRGARMLYKQHLSPDEIRREREAYDASIAYLDSQLRALLASLRARGLLDNTLVIITSDHGEQFSDRGLFVHGNSLYEPVMSVPLLMALPGRVPAGRVIGNRVNTRELAATVLDLTGNSVNARLPGKSLARYWAPDRARLKSSPLFFEVVTSRSEVLRSVVLGDTQYVRHGNGTEELYLLQRNQNTPDLAEVPAKARQLRRLRMRVDSILARTGPDRWGS